jgi:DNA polymerase (family 10)
MKSLRQELIEHLEILAFYAKWKNENPFKTRAFERASENLARIPDEEFKTRLKEESLTEIDGIGKGIALIAQEFSKTKNSQERQKIQGDLPLDLWKLTEIAGLGVKKIKTLYEGLHLQTLGELEYACRENRLISLEGFGVKSQEKILKEIERIKQRQGLLLLPEAIAEAQKMEKKFDPKSIYAAVGELGRKEEVLSKLEYLVVGQSKWRPLAQDSAASFSSKFTEKKEIDFKLHSGTPVVFYFTTKEAFGVESVFRTSSIAHWQSLKRQAKKCQLELTEDELMSPQSKLRVSCDRELYAHLQIPYHPPEVREWGIEKKALRLVEVKDLEGSFHSHTHFSDGLNSVEEMATAAQALGWKYLGISEHSQSAFYAHGVEEKRLDTYFETIKKCNEKMKDFKVFAGIESDILKEGELDYPNKILKKFDFVIASIHQRYGMKDMTHRILQAIKNPHTRMIGHISGRLLLGRDAYAYDLDKIVREAISKKVVMELNASPQRLDLNWRELHEAAQAGLLISINSDAHSVEALEDVQWGVWMARKAQVPSDQIINTWDFKIIDQFIREGRAS